MDVELVELEMHRAHNLCDASIEALRLRLETEVADLDAAFETKRGHEHETLIRLAHAQRRRFHPRASSSSLSSSRLEVLAVVTIRDAEEDAALHALQHRFEQAVARLKHTRAALVADAYAWYVNEIETLVNYKEALCKIQFCLFSWRK